MPDPVLLLRLEGPLQSWGVRARWDVRDTGQEPTKSGIVGLLGCALGLPRRHARLQNLDRSLRFAVRLDRPGTALTDYHTVTGRHRMASGKLKTEDYTVQSYRDYLHDAAFLVALQGEAGLLDELAGGLSSPQWPLYLGRKSCLPTRPVLDRIAEYDSLDDAVGRAAWSAPLNARARRSIARTFAPPSLPMSMKTWLDEQEWEASGPDYTLEAWVEADDGEAERQDRIMTNTLRFYGFRRARELRVQLHDLEVLGP